MSYPQQPGNWSDQSWPNPNQPYSDPGYGGYPGYPASATPASPGYGYGYGGYAQPVPVRQTNGLAIAAMVVALAGILMCGIPSIVGAIMGHVARRQIRERGEDGDGMALTGVIVGWIVFGLSAVGWLLYVLLIVWAVNESSTYDDPYTYDYFANLFGAFR
jgi:Domain of unknown function (DUF4190)